LTSSAKRWTLFPEPIGEDRDGHLPGARAMQPTPTVPDGAAEPILAQPVTTNRLVLRESADRMSALLADAQRARDRAQHLREELRQKLAMLAEEIFASREWRSPVRSHPPVVPRYSPTEPDPLDAVRRQLHETYAETRDPAVRAELMSSYDAFARSLALKFRHRESVEDLTQVARIGLLHAIDRFDPALGRPFPLFARITITGELKRHIRDKTWSMRVPRSLQEDYLNVMRAVDELTGEQSESPTMQVVAERCGLSVDRVLEAMELRVSQRALSIDVPAVMGSDDPVIELGQEDAGFSQLENRQLLGNLLRRLPERDRRIVELRFIDELTQSEIAAKVGVSQMCVSRVLARTIGRLRLWARTALN
jgi:RNA polymerase sigma-B factor